MKAIFSYIFLLMIGFKCNLSQSPSEQVLLNNSVLQDSAYKRDSAELLSLMKMRMERHESSFFSKEYNDSTQILIDSILYNSEKSKIAVFVITKNPINRKTYQLSSVSKNLFYYDAYCYLGKKVDSLSVWDIRWFNTFALSNFASQLETSERIRWKYFNELISVKDTSGKSYYKYNLNDERFWTGPVWRKFFD